MGEGKKIAGGSAANQKWSWGSKFLNPPDFSRRHRTKFIIFKFGFKFTFKFQTCNLVNFTPFL
jgi:hypothetical protein